MQVSSKETAKDPGRLHIHVKVGRFWNVVTPQTDFSEKMTPLHQQKS